MGNHDVMPHHARVLKTKSAKNQQKSLPPSSAKKTLKTKVNDSVSEQQDGEQQIPRQEIDGDQILFNKKHVVDQIPYKQRETQDNGEDRIPLKQQETQENEEDKIQSNKNKDEDRIPPNSKKTRYKRRTFQEPYLEVFVLTIPTR